MSFIIFELHGMPDMTYREEIDVAEFLGELPAVKSVSPCGVDGGPTAMTVYYLFPLDKPEPYRIAAETKLRHRWPDATVTIHRWQ